MNALTISTYIGILAVVLTIAFPIIFWVSLNRIYTPVTRKSYALKFSLWPAILFSSQFGGPVARKLMGYNSTYSRDIWQTFQGVLGIAIILAPVFFAIGYWIGKRYCREMKPDNAEEIKNEDNKPEE